MKTDLTGLADIQLMVDDFYRKVKHDDLLGGIFFAHIGNDWGPHLAKMYTFWNAALFGVKGYVGNPFARHAHMPLTIVHFQRWLYLFDQTVNTHFAGPVAEDAKQRGAIMARTFLSRLNAAGHNPATTIA